MTRAAGWMLVAVTLGACGGSSDLLPTEDAAVLPADARVLERVSAATASSHQIGTNCAGCHAPEGNARGFFTASGSVRRMDDAPFPNVTMEMRTAPMGSGDLVVRAVTDRDGNFYTTQPTVDPPRPLFVSLVAPDGRRRAMPFPSLSGQCNFCHVGRQRFRWE